METALIVATDAGEVQTVEQKFWAVVDLWLKDIAESKDRKARTLEVYRYNMKVFKDWLDSQGIERATRQDIKDWKSSMTARGWSVPTKNLYLATVRSFYKWLEDNHGVDNIAAGIEGWKNSREHKRGFLSIGEMKDLLACVEPCTQKKLDATKNQSQRERILLQGKRDKAILTALMCGGLRTIEISRLRVCDLTHDGGAAMLNVLGKGRDERETVKISRKAERVIRDWLTAREKADVVSDDSPLFCSLGNNSFGDPITSLSVSRLCKEYLRAAGLKEKEYTTDDKEKKTKVKPIVAHSLRASCATEAFHAGASLDQVKQQLRHKNLSTTQIYLEESKKLKNPVSDIISDGIF